VDFRFLSALGVTLIGAVLSLPPGVGHAVGPNSAQTGVAGRGQDEWLQTNGRRLKARVYPSVDPGDRPLLVVVLHGDLRGVRAVPGSTLCRACRRWISPTASRRRRACT
jgi:hypothetical protein